jgi:hypothetical protein
MSLHDEINLYLNNAQAMSEGTKRVNRSRKTKRDRKHNGQKKQYKKKNIIPETKELERYILKYHLLKFHIKPKHASLKLVFMCFIVILTSNQV